MIRYLALMLMIAAPAFADEDGTLSFQGIERHYRLHEATGRSAPAPLIVALHGLGESVGEVQRSWTMDAVADREKFNVVYPSAVADRWSYSPARPVRLPGGSALVDDISFINALLDKLVDAKVADPARLYVTGLSNGGLMTWTLACTSSNRFAAAAPMITGMLEAQRDGCHPDRQIPILAIDGTDDFVQFYDGWLFPGFRLMSVPETMEFWRKARGCKAEKADFMATHETTDPTRALWIDWTDCDDAAKLRLYRLSGAGHRLPSYALVEAGQRRRHGGRSQTIEAAETIWSFFSSGGDAIP